MKGIILAGGSGTRLYPLTTIISKQLQPIYDKPMIYYPLSTLMMAGIREILIISTPRDTPRFEELLGTGEQWGITLSYQIQPEPKGIAQAFLVGENFIGTDPVMLILGDNIFHGHYDFLDCVAAFKSGARIFGYPVDDPERYGVIQFDKNGKALNIEEKPKKAKSNYAVPGLYIYDNQVIMICKNLKPSPRGELEITDVNNVYLEKGQLYVEKMGRGLAWLDTGTCESLHDAANFVSIIEKRQGLKICCPEEVAFRKGFIDAARFSTMIQRLPKSSYRAYLEKILDEESVSV